MMMNVQSSQFYPVSQDCQSQSVLPHPDHDHSDDTDIQQYWRDDHVTQFPAHYYAFLLPSDLDELFGDEEDNVLDLCDEEEYVLVQCDEEENVLAPSTPVATEEYITNLITATCEDADLCEAEWRKLPETERARYQRIAPSAPPPETKGE